MVDIKAIGKSTSVKSIDRQAIEIGYPLVNIQF